MLVLRRRSCSLLPVLIPRAAILEAITRCESVCNPALIEKRLFSIHVRRLPASEGRGWVVRVIDKESISKDSLASLQAIKRQDERLIQLV
jgi:hypothetical protein